MLAMSFRAALEQGCRYNHLIISLPVSPMPATLARTVRLASVLAACAAVSACSSVDSASTTLIGAVTPYRVEVVQGNFVSREQVQALKPGMSREQVRDVLGTPLIASVFHGDRWDYVFTLKRQGVEPQQRKLTVYFKGSLLDRFEGDTMPTEAEFVATLDNKRKDASVPPLEANEETLNKFVPERAAPAPAVSPPPPPAAASYPPLEAPGS
jgi:outer membrane protein assembly factor BamE